MKVIDQINGSAFFAQSAYSASIATKDSLGQDITATYITAINIPESADWEDTSTVVHTNSSNWNDTTEVVQTNSASWGSTPTYDYTTNNLISAIDTNRLYAYSAGFANALINGGRLGTDVYAVTGAGTTSMTLMILNPNTTPFGNTSGIYGPLRYAQGACMTYGSSAGNTQYFGGFVKGNEWYVSNATAGQALRGETHQTRGVHLSGATTAGNSFDLSTSAVSGKNDTANNYNWKLERGCVSGNGINGEWRYGPAEDTALRTASAWNDTISSYQNASGTYLQGVSSDSTLSGDGTVNSPLGIVNPLPYPMEIVSTSSEATGTNILYVVTGAGA